MIVLAGSLAFAYQLQSLNLNRNRIGAQGASALATGLVCCSALKDRLILWEGLALHFGKTRKVIISIIIGPSGRDHEPPNELCSTLDPTKSLQIIPEKIPDHFWKLLFPDP